MNRNLLLTGWLLFLLCLALPAVTLNSNLGFSANNQAEFGLGAGILAVLSIVSIFDSYREFQVSMLGIGNILALLCPLLLFLSNKFIHALFFLILALSLIFAVKLSIVEEHFLINSFHVGYYVWLVSYLLLCLASGLAYKNYARKNI